MSDERKRKARKFTNGRGEGRGDGYAGTNLTSWTYRDGTPGRNHVDAKSLATEPTVYLRDPDVTLWHGEVLDALQKLPDESVHCVVTSPPYWGLRDYGTGSWEGGDADCDHSTPRSRGDDIREGDKQGTSAGSRPNTQTVCKCGAQRTDQQLGLEPTPDLYIERMVAVFREVRRVLRRDGTCWLNIGDSYAHNGACGGSSPDGDRAYRATDRAKQDQMSYRVPPGLKPKDLVGIPWKLAFALQADGWWLRADIIWSKPNPMPESVTDRPTKAHEYVFMLTRSPRYFFDQEAIREPGGYQLNSFRDEKYVNDNAKTTEHPHRYRKGAKVVEHPNGGRNVRSVWTIATEPYPDAHFATFPTELARRCILAGTSERGCCPECEAPWERITEASYHAQSDNPNTHSGGIGGSSGHRAPDGSFTAQPKLSKKVKTLGWRPSCDCDTASPSEDLLRAAKFEPVPSTVLDPFVGSGTVPYVARLHNRHAIGVDLNADYLELAARRLQQQSLFAGTHP